MFEWSPEVAIALSTRFCSWVVAETDAEHYPEESEESKSLVLGLRGNRRNSSLQIRNRSRNNSQKSAGANRPSLTKEDVMAVYSEFTPVDMES